jgi:hypothetical protein
MTKASLSADRRTSAASLQETTRVGTSISGKSGPLLDTCVERVR